MTLETIGMVIGGVALVMVLPLAWLKAGGARWIMGGATLLAGWILARGVAWVGWPVVAPGAAADRPPFSAMLTGPRGPDVLVFVIFVVLGLLMARAVAKARRG